MLTKDQAVTAARAAVEGTYDPAQLDRIDVALRDGKYVVKFVLKLPPNTVGGSFVQVTLDAQTGRVLERLLDAS